VGNVGVVLPVAVASQRGEIARVVLGGVRTVRLLVRARPRVRPVVAEAGNDHAVPGSEDREGARERAQVAVRAVDEHDGAPAADFGVRQADGFGSDGVARDRSWPR
jgi:hypothetical protein